MMRIEMEIKKEKEMATQKKKQIKK